MKKLASIILLSSIYISSLCAATSFEESRIYIDNEELNCEKDSFRIHTGHNVWIETDTVHRDKTGLYTYERHINKYRGGPSVGYEKTWKCPYCYNYWPEGKPCGNSKCPSKNK